VIRTFSPVYIPSRAISPPFSQGVGYSPFHHNHPPIYNIKRSTVNVYDFDSGKSVRVMSMGQCLFPIPA